MGMGFTVPLGTVPLVIHISYNLYTQRYRPRIFFPGSWPLQWHAALYTGAAYPRGFTVLTAQLGVRTSTVLLGLSLPLPLHLGILHKFIY